MYDFEELFEKICYDVQWMHLKHGEVLPVVYVFGKRNELINLRPHLTNLDEVRKKINDLKPQMCFTVFTGPMQVFEVGRDNIETGKCICVIGETRDICKSRIFVLDEKNRIVSIRDFDRPLSSQILFLYQDFTKV